MTIIATAVLLLLASFPHAASASGALNHAGLVIRHGDGRLIYAYIAFPEESITGVELLRRSGISLVTIGFGGLGEGVCTIDDEGCPASDCRKKVCQGNGPDAPFWQYFRQTAPGDWRSLSLGASSTKVHDGDIDGWSWTGHDAGIPAVSMADVLHLTGVAASPEMDSGSVPTPVVHIVLPPGYVQPDDDDDQQPVVVYLLGAVALLAIGGAAAFALRRRPQQDDAA